MRKGDVSIEIIAAVVILIIVILYFWQLFSGKTFLSSVPSITFSATHECNPNGIRKCSNGKCISIQNSPYFCGCLYDIQCSVGTCVNNRCV